MEKMPVDMKKLFNQTYYDVMFGPSGEEDYPGFITATKKLSEFEINEVWVDMQFEIVSESEPEELYDVYHFDYSDVKRIVFGELANNV